MELHTVIDNLPYLLGAEGSEAAMGTAANSGDAATSATTATLSTLAHEHGLCFFFSLDGKNYLIDTGASGAFARNMGQMGLCRADEVDAVFISHGHNDHTGGLRKFLEQNTTAPVYLHNTIRDNYFYSCRPRKSFMPDGTHGHAVREARNIGMEQALFTDYSNRFIEIEGPTRITEKISLIPVSAAAGYPTPMGNEFLYCNDLPDKFTHETAILVEYAPGGFAVISPCSHNGILNILEVCRKWIEEMYEHCGNLPQYCGNISGCSADLHESLSGYRGNLSGRGEIKCLIGGLHYVDYLGMGQGAKEAASITETARILKEKYPALKIFSGHCTCPAASEVLKGELQENYSCFCSGYSICL